MPEGPECKLYANALNELLANNAIYGIKVLSGRYAKTSLPLTDESFPMQVKSVKCKGKFIYFESSNNKYIWNTLGLTGGWSLRSGTDTRIVFNNSHSNFYYSDQRNFGTFKFNCSREDTIKKLDSLGVDLLGADRGDTLPHSIAVFSNKKNQNKTLAEIVMDQANYAGVGNYIKAEALYLAKLSPHRLGKSLSQTDIEHLHVAIHSVINASFEGRKPSLEIYGDLPEPNPAIFKKVIYRNTLDPLGNEIKAEATKDKRTTYWVPGVQI